MMATDPTTETQVSSPGLSELRQGNAAMSLKNFRKDIVINVLNLQGAVAMSYKVFRCWVSEFQALPEFDAGTRNAVAIQMIKLENEGWERDVSVTEPTET